MRNVIPLRSEDRKERAAHTQLRDRAEEDLSFIRATMERATAFTLVPGIGGIGMGLCGLAGAWIAAGREPGLSWLALWVATAGVALMLGVAGIAWKSRRLGIEVPRRPARRFALGFVPSLLVGALLTAALIRADQFELLPGVWLLTYGTAVIAGGAFSVSVVPMMGAGFLAFGAAALFTAPELGNLWLGAGFGGLQIVFGAIIARRYGG